MANIDKLKMENIQHVRKCFYEGGIWTKNELAEKTQLSLAGTTNVLQDLLKKGEIEYVGDAASTGGRKSKNYQLKASYASIMEVLLKRNRKDYIVDIEIKDLSGNLLLQHIDTKSKYTENDLIEELKKCIAKQSNIRVIVIAYPGVVKNGILGTGDFEELEGFHLADEIQESTGIDCVIENDVNLVTVALGKQYSQYANLGFIYQPNIRFSGAGFLINGEVYQGRDGAAGEVQYLPVLTHEKQIEMLENNPEKLLQIQMDTMQTILNLDAIAWYSLAFDGELREESSIPEEYQAVKIHITDMNAFMKQGLEKTGRNYLWRERK